MSVVLRFARGPISGVVLLLASWACASDDLLVYSDRRNNGWQDWGWIPHYSTNAPVHSGSTAICVQPNGGWQAWWLEHDDLDTSLYTSLVFWIHGGPVGGQSVGVNALLDNSGDGLPRVSVGTGGKLAAST